MTAEREWSREGRAPSLMLMSFNLEVFAQELCPVRRATLSNMLHAVSCPALSIFISFVLPKTVTKVRVLNNGND